MVTNPQGSTSAWLWFPFATVKAMLTIPSLKGRKYTSVYEPIALFWLGMVLDSSDITCLVSQGFIPGESYVGQNTKGSPESH